MTKLQVMEQNGQRVLTTAQLAESFGTDTQNISRNFVRNQDRYTLGKHYFALEGEQKRAFLNHVQIDDGLRNAKTLYLWTEKGAWMHAKSLNTDEAWIAYETLVDDYYTVKTTVTALDERQLRTQLFKAALEHEERLDTVEQRIEVVEKKVEEQITLDSGAQRTLQKYIARRVYDLASDFKTRRELFTQLYREIKDRWAVPSYKDVRKTELPEVLRYVDAWKPRIA